MEGARGSVRQGGTARIAERALGLEGAGEIARRARRARLSSSLAEHDVTVDLRLLDDPAGILP